MATDTGNRTLDLFWKTMKACNIGEIEAQKILRKIEEKNHYRVSSLKKTVRAKRVVRTEAEIKKNRGDYNQTVILSPKLIEFLKEARQRSTKKTMALNAGISVTTYYTAMKTKRVSIQSYEKIMEAKERWETMKKEARQG